MKPKRGFLYRFPFYPLLVGIYPLLYFWLANVYQVPAFVVTRPLLLSLAITAAAWVFFLLLFRNLRKAAAATAFFLALFFVYGRIFDLTARWVIFGITIGHRRYVMMLFVALVILVAVLLFRTRASLMTLTWGANLVASFMILLVVAQLAYAGVGSLAAIQSQDTPTPQPAPKVTASIPQATLSTPDVYYILLDGYDRQDLLKQDIGVDDSAFITQLKNLGFVLPDCTQSNYNTTVFSVASAFNMNYLDALGFSYNDLAGAAYGVDLSTPELEASIHTNTVMKQFHSMGYQIITLQSAYPFLNFPQSDIVYTYTQLNPPKIETTKFQYAFWKTTGMDYLIEETTGYTASQFDSLPLWLQQMINDNYSLYQKYQADLYDLDKLDHITDVPGKKFVYAHLMVTHPDFAFTADGAFRDDSEETKAAYGDAVTYADQRILAIVKNILAKSKTPPIIILQGDHGYGYGGRGVEQFKILNAYYLPQGGGSAVYPSITPVNTFRLILSRYFGQNDPLLPDQSIWVHDTFEGGYQMEAGTCQAK